MFIVRRAESEACLNVASISRLNSHRLSLTSAVDVGVSNAVDGRLFQLLLSGGTMPLSILNLVSLNDESIASPSRFIVGYANQGRLREMSPLVREPDFAVHR